MHIFFGDTVFNRRFWGRKPPGTQKDIIVIFEELFSVLNYVMGGDYLLRKNVIVK